MNSSNRLAVTRPNRRPRKLLIIPVLAALLLTAVAAGQAGATTGPAGIDTSQADDGDLAYSEPGLGPADCKGGAHLRTVVKMNDQPTSISRPEGAPANFVALPDAEVPFNSGSYQVSVIFTAEARLYGHPIGNERLVPADFLQVRILLDGVPMTPLNDLMFTSDVGQANATQACQRVEDHGGPHLLKVQWLLVDQRGPNDLKGTLDDWALRVELNA